MARLSSARRPAAAAVALVTLLATLSASSCRAEPVPAHTIMEHVDVPAVTRVLEARSAAAVAAAAADPAETEPEFSPVPSPSPAQRAAMARVPPTLLQSSRRARLVTKQKYLKKDWCKTEPLVRRLREPGCRSRRVIDRFCYGQCNSFYIPREGRRRRAFKSCPSCLPRRWERVSVLFHCPGQVPARRRRSVRLVKQCRCMTRRRN